MNKLILVIFLIISTNTYSHSGGTDKYGGHTNHSTGSYHLHSSSSYKLPLLAASSLWDWATSSESEPTKRNPSNRAAFHSSNPCPSTGLTSGPCPGYHVDHIVPLACGGSDSPSNMQWLTASANLSKGSLGCRY
jgi:5-methylcytosine-specific restriction endonuclease McrA